MARPEVKYKFPFMELALPRVREHAFPSPPLPLAPFQEALRKSKRFVPVVNSKLIFYQKEKEEKKRRKQEKIYPQVIQFKNKFFPPLPPSSYIELYHTHTYSYKRIYPRFVHDFLNSFSFSLERIRTKEETDWNTNERKGEERPIKRGRSKAIPL